MAEEIEKLPPKEGEATEKEKEKSPAKAPNPWIPVAVMLVMIPVLSFGLTMYILVPKLRHAIETAVAEVKPVQEKGSGKVNSGEGSGKVYKYDFKDVIANLSGSLHSRYVKVAFSVEGDAPDFVGQVEANKAKLIDAALGVLSALDIVELEKPEAKNLIRNSLLTAFELALNKELIHHLYFSEFVVQ